jgi:EpsI family protein
MTFLRGKYVLALTVLLLVQGALYYAVALRDENIPAVAPLSAFPTEAGPWHLFKEFPIEKEIQDILKADDTLNRLYVGPDGSAAWLSINFFKSQRSGQAPHSPKNCLPGAGWEALESEPLTLAVPGRAEPILTNRYVVARGNEKSVVLYWYQSRNRIIAGEFSAKFWLIADSIKYHRSDSAVVKIVVQMRPGGDTDAATKTAIDFVKSVFPAISRQLPS